MNYLGIDIGGTSVKIGLINEKGHLLDKTSFKFDYKLSQEKQIKSLGLFVLDYLKSLNKDVESIGIGCPGSINSKDGVCEYSNNIPWTNLSVVSIMEDVTHKKCYIANDANVAVLGEARFGSAKDYQNVILLTLGTGVGGGLYLNGSLYEGEDGKGAELGHMSINPFSGRMCTCGAKGCLEAYASATALINDAKEKIKEDKNTLIYELSNNEINNISAKTIFEAAKRNDKTATNLVDAYVNYLCYGLVNFINIFRPEVILLSGGVSNAGDYLIKKIDKKLFQIHYGFGSKDNKKIPVLIATLGADTGIFGAAALAMHK